MAGYNGEAGRSLNENIYCELQNKTQTPTGPNRREDSLEFRCECRGSERLARGALMANVKGPRSSQSPPWHSLSKCVANRETPVDSSICIPDPRVGHPALQKALRHPHAEFQEQTPPPPPSHPFRCTAHQGLRHLQPPGPHQEQDPLFPAHRVSSILTPRGL